MCLMLDPSTVDAVPVLSELLFGTAGHDYSSKYVLFLKCLIKRKSVNKKYVFVRRASKNQKDDIKQDPF